MEGSIDKPLDFKCTPANDMYYGVLAKRVRHFKETERDNEHTCKLLEDMRNEAAKEASITASIDAARFYGIADDKILRDIMKRFDITESEAKDYLLPKKIWKIEKKYLHFIRIRCIVKKEIKEIRARAL